MKLAKTISDAWTVLRSGGLSSLAAQWLRGEDSGSSGGAVLHNAYQQVVWVYACIQALSEQVANIPFKFSIGERGGEQQITGGPLVDLYRQPHKYIGSFQYWELRVMYLMLRGECFRVPIYDGRKLAGILILDPAYFQHIVEANELVGWRYTGFGTQAPLETQVFLPEELYHDKLSNPFNFWRGMSPLSVARLSAQTDYAAGSFMKGLMENNADTGVIVTTDQQADPEQREAILAALRERKRKAGTADRPLFLWGGAKIEKPQLSSSDMQFLENRRYSRSEICAVFRVPEEIIVSTDTAKYDVMDGARLNFIENRVAPLCARLESDELQQVKSINPKAIGWFDIDSLPIMQKARQSRFTAARDAFQGMGVPLNECNKIFNLGLPATLPHGNKSYIPYSIIEVGTAEAPQTDVAEGDEPKPKDDALKSLDVLFTRLVEGRTPASPKPIPAHRLTGSPAHVCSQSDAYAASIAGSIRLKNSKLRNFFFDQRIRVITNLEKVKTFNLSRADGVAQKGIEDIFDQDNEDNILLTKINPLLRKDLEFGGAQLWKEIGLDNFIVPPAEAIAYLRKRENEIKNINETTFASLKDALAEGLEKGETFEQLVDRVKGVYNEASDRRAETIALTETNTAVNAGRYEGMKQARVEKKSWLASNLANSRPSHQQAGQDYEAGIPIDDHFIVGGEKMLHPGDPSASPGNVINCKCTTIAMSGEKAFLPTKFLTFEEFTAKQSKALPSVSPSPGGESPQTGQQVICSDYRGEGEPKPSRSAN